VNEAVNQIAFADIVLLNKIDRVSAEELQAARDLVRSINVTADVIEVALAGGDGTAAGQQPGWDRLMGINSFSIERALQVGRMCVCVCVCVQASCMAWVGCHWLCLGA
jgi:hypothetical protein